MRTAGWMAAAAMVWSGSLAGQTGAGPFARVGLMRVREGMTGQFEAGYQRHLAWHRGQRDPWAWYGWSVAFGERVDWFMDATFGRSASSLDSSVAPAADGADFDANVAPYEEYMVNAVYEFLPAASDGGATPPVAQFLELATFDLAPGAETAFEQAIRGQARSCTGCRWYRQVSGGQAPRYLRLRSFPSLAASTVPPPNDPAVAGRVTRLSVELLRFRSDLSTAPR